MDTALFLGFGLAYAALLAWGLMLAARHGWATPANLPLLVLAGLVYDNLLLGAGRWIGAGPALEGLNLARFWIHALVTPVLVAWALHALRRAGFAWARAGWFQSASIVAAVGLVVVEFLTEVRGLRLVAREEYGALSYTDARPASGPPIMVLVVALVLIIVGALLWKRVRWPWLFAGAVVMTIGSAVEIPVASGAATNAFELVLLVSVMRRRRSRTGRGESRRIMMRDVAHRDVALGSCVRPSISIPRPSRPWPPSGAPGGSASRRP
ncbi:hypothetical protein [Mariniluteicoccus flavus]